MESATSREEARVKRQSFTQIRHVAKEGHLEREFHQEESDEDQEYQGPKDPLPTIDVGVRNIKLGFCRLISLA